MEALLPIKHCRLQSNLVNIDYQHKKVVTSTLQIAKSLEVRHYDILRKVDLLLQKGLIDKRDFSFIYYRDSANRKQKSYELNEQSALQVIMGLSGKKAEQLHKVIAQAFIELKKELHQWKTGRLLATDATKQANDEVAWLQVELAKDIPSSGKPKLLFVHIQIAINKAVTGLGKKLDRNTLPIDHLKGIERLEQAVQAEIKQLKVNGVAPEQIRLDVLAMIKSSTKKETPTSDQTEMELT